MVSEHMSKLNIIMPTYHPCWKEDICEIEEGLGRQQRRVVVRDCYYYEIIQYRNENEEIQEEDQDSTFDRGSIV